MSERRQPDSNDASRTQAMGEAARLRQNALAEVTQTQQIGGPAPAGPSPEESTTPFLPSAGPVPTPPLAADQTHVLSSGGPDTRPFPASEDTDPDATRMPTRTEGFTAFGPGGASATRGDAVVGRFALSQLHAKGGLGEVFTARDVELNREVALKRIQVQFADDPASKRRFVAEAEITARLDHPGVVPVFGLVSDEHGRPCYAMRFIRGETLKDEIERFYVKLRGARRDMREVRLAVRQLLQRFFAVCQAIGYAHSRGVIHRDIKPANIMVGTFGETLVVDWGLAKLMRNSDCGFQLEDPAGFVPGSTTELLESNPELTEMGAIVGTPAYMAPEQARGEQDKIGPPADVYSLGATLYVILTGHAPLSDLNTLEILVRAQQGEVPTPRSLNPLVPKPLDAICRKAMAVRIEDRYPSALDLAADIERWLSDEPVGCCPDPPLARMARWGRRHPARVTGMVSLLATGLIATMVGLAAVDRERSRTGNALLQLQEEQARTKAALEAETSAKLEAANQRALAELARDTARNRYVLAREAFATLVGSIQNRLQDRVGTQDLRRDLLEAALAGLRNLIANPAGDHGATDSTFFMAHMQMGMVQWQLGHTTLARQEYLEAHDIAERRIRAYPLDLIFHQNKAAVDDQLAALALEMGDTTTALASAREGLAVCERLQKEKQKDESFARDLATARSRLCQVLLERGDTFAAAEAGGQALAERRAIADADPLDPTARKELAQSLDRYAEIQLRTGQTAAARQSAQESLNQWKLMVGAAPKNPFVLRGLANAYGRLAEVAFEMAELNKATLAYREAEDQLRKLVEADPRSGGAKSDLASVLGRLGYVLLRAADAKSAMQKVQESNELFASLAAADPDSARAQYEYAFGLHRLGDLQLELGESRAARQTFERSREILHERSQADPASLRCRRDEAIALARLGEADLALNDAASAIRAIEESLAIRRQVLAADPGAVRSRRELAISEGLLSDAYLKADRPALALESAQESLAEFRKVAAADPGRRQAKRDVAVFAGKVGYILLRQGETKPALDACRESLAIFEELEKADAENAQARRDVAIAQTRLVDVYERLGDAKNALAAAQLSLSIGQALAEKNAASAAARKDVMLAMMRLGSLLANAGDYPGAARWFRDGLKVPEGFAKPEALAYEAGLLKGELDAVEAVIAGAAEAAAVAKFPPAARSRASRVLIAGWLGQGQAARASQAATVLAANAASADDLYTAAAGTAACVGLTKSQADQERYAAAAIGYLKHAVADGYRNVAALKQDRGWDAIRRRDDFRAILGELEKLPPVAPMPRRK